MYIFFFIFCIYPKFPLSTTTVVVLEQIECCQHFGVREVNEDGVAVTKNLHRQHYRNCATAGPSILFSNRTTQLSLFVPVFNQHKT